MRKYIEYNKKRLMEILDDMDIPEFRKSNVNGGPDLLWLSRNMFIRNSEHKNFLEAIELIRAGIRQGV
jgi:hypothetical protein